MRLNRSRFRRKKKERRLHQEGLGSVKALLWEMKESKLYRTDADGRILREFLNKRQQVFIKNGNEKGTVYNYQIRHIALFFFGQPISDSFRTRSLNKGPGVWSLLSVVLVQFLQDVRTEERLF
jgi:hypothetical protein